MRNMALFVSLVVLGFMVTVLPNEGCSKPTSRPSGQGATKDAKSFMNQQVFPIVLSLKQPVPHPVTVDEIPPFVYEKQPPFQSDSAAWITEIDLGNGKKTTVAFRGGGILLPGEKGELGRENKGRSLAISPCKPYLQKDKPLTVRIALIEETDELRNCLFSPFPDEERKRKANDFLSNWVEFSVILGSK